MAEAVVEQQPPSARFYCHRCNIEFEDLAQDFICPQCEGGFIEQLENDPDDSLMSHFDDDISVLDMSMDDPFDLSHPVANDLAMLMTGGRINRGVGGGAEALLQQFAWALAGGGGADGNGPSPLVLVGSPGDYVLGGEGLDAVVTQLLGQLEGSGPAPLSRDKIAAIPSIPVTSVHVDARMQCSVCWDQFNIEEKVSQLLCTHMFHTACIEPWLKLHATCPICRRSLQPDTPHSPPATTGGVGTPPAAPPPSNTVEASIPSLSALLWRSGVGGVPAAPRRRRPARPSDNATSGWLATPAATTPAAAPAPSSSGSAPTLFGNIFRAAINMSRPNTNSSQSNTSTDTSSNSSSNASSNSGSSSSSSSSTNMDVADPDVPTPEQRRSNTAGYMMDMDIDFD